MSTTGRSTAVDGAIGTTLAVTTNSDGPGPFRIVGEDLRDVRLVVERIRAAVAGAAASGTPGTWRIKRVPGPLR